MSRIRVQQPLESVHLVANTGASTDWNNRPQQRLLREKWKVWIEDPLYNKVVLYLIGGLQAHVNSDVGQNEKRRIDWESRRYILGESSEPKLFYHEKGDKIAGCVLSKDINGILG